MTRLVLKESVFLFFEVKNTIVINGTRKWTIEDQEKEVYNSLFRFKLEGTICYNSDIYKFLIENNLVIEKVENKFKKSRFEKNIFYINDLDKKYDFDANNFQNNLNEKTILLLGCGGIGTVVLKNLLSFGIGHFVLVDRDTVDVSNLNRQLFFDKDDINKPKASVISKKLLNYDDKITCTVVNQYIDTKEKLEKIVTNYTIDFLINAADYPQNLSEMVFNVCKKHKIAFIEGSVGIETGVWGPIYDFENKNPCVESVPKLSENKHTLTGSICSTNMIVGTLMANDLFSYWLDRNKKTIFKQKKINFDSLEIVVTDYGSVS